MFFNLNKLVHYHTHSHILDVNKRYTNIITVACFLCKIKKTCENKISGFSISDGVGDTGTEFPVA